MHKVIVVHNSYQQAGGEDAVVESEVRLLQDRGHRVVQYHRSNHDLNGMSRLNAAAQTLWSRRTAEEFSVLIRKERPDVVHVHNTFPLISPSVYWAAHATGIPVVQTLHNYRLLCPQAMLLKEGKVCEECVGRIPWLGAMHGCYRKSRVQSATLATMLTAHRWLGTYRSRITRYIALTEFGRQKFVAGGLPAEKVRVKPNFVTAPSDAMAGKCLVRRGFLFVGRLSPEKGIVTLAEALKATPGIACEVIGEGPERGMLQGLGNVRPHGWQGKEFISRKMRSAVALIMPSVWLETFGLVVVEAFSNSLPVIASRIGAMATIVEDGRTGLLFEPGDPKDLAEKLRWAATHPAEMAAMGDNALAEYHAKYTPERNYQMLMSIYDEAIAETGRTSQ